MKGKNILCIYYHFPPIKGIGTLRNVKFYNSIKKDARKVFVMTTSNRRFLPSDEFNLELEDIISLPTMDFRTIHNRLFNSKGSLIQNKTPTKLSSLLLEVIDSSPLQVILGEGGLRFYRKGVKRGKLLIESQGIDTIVSSFRPLATHLIARQLKKLYPHITWIADFRDITPDPMRNNSRLHNFKVSTHQRILKYADEALTVSDGLKKNILSYHDKVTVIRNGFEHSLINNDPPKKASFFTLTYTGIIYRKTQRADLIFRALRELVDEGEMAINNLRFMHAGKDIDYWREVASQYNLVDIIVDKGLIPRKESIELQRSSNLNILLTWASEKLQGIVTGKVYEYLAARRPILSIINGVKDYEIEKIIEGTESGKVFYHNKKDLLSIKSYLLSEYHRWKQNDLRLNEDGPILTYSWENQFRAWNMPLRVIKTDVAVSK